MSGESAAILLAAGQGRRLGHDKSITEIAGQPVLAHPLRALVQVRGLGRIVVTVRGDAREAAEAWLAGSDLPKERIRFFPGGKERQDSVQEGLAALEKSVEWVVVHDAARVLTTHKLIERVMEGARATGAAAAASRMSDTVRAADASGRILRLVDREGLWRMETPQVVRAEVLRKGLAIARERKITVTDCLAAAELAGVQGVLVESGEPNLKITVPSDWALSEAWLKQWR
ncbi:MAG: 2-C-methyl-D-erythritol 4-phosphate cytidylyltransferase [Verrucomicrobia bacterium]|nr:2-C-methyl-D-erythritol 4-phosphate cytidylyltransferase [Verrucomicrobiota bacterium]NBU69485.1 2-C-methyl-D-erythritol 4-phosphate cytidylyltransferase [Verrucomicrobiota bacterium]NDC00681.1 2-C-methyl-D-erythritol 4-phosphate cytidylyltransferase [Verrucomicrobiota bacterium]NDF17293.1 2-C-methyl-D-erythritol 4-phosphate cytidylyltransferase [Verrucomicrobiota bacterium]